MYCGSRPGTDGLYAEAADALGRAIARRGMGLVYGGGSVGLMGIVADAVLAEGGDVIGVIPHGLAAREVDHIGVKKLHKVSSMHERKGLMADLSSAFVALPGGIGTLEELSEMWSWAYLGIHRKPVGILNINGYYDDLLTFMNRALSDGFVKPIHRDLLLTADDPETILDLIENYEAPELLQWVTEEER